MTSLTYQCLVCNSKRPCVLSNLIDSDDAPTICPLDLDCARWVLEGEESEPYDAKEARAEKYADARLEAEKDAKLLAKLS